MLAVQLKVGVVVEAKIDHDVGVEVERAHIVTGIDAVAPVADGEPVVATESNHTCIEVNSFMPVPTIVTAVDVAVDACVGERLSQDGPKRKLKRVPAGTWA